MKDSKYFADLWQCSVDTINRADIWRSYGETNHQSGNSFVYHYLSAALHYTLAFDHMSYRLEKLDELNALVNKPGGFANLPISRDVVLMTALMPAVNFLKAQAAIHESDTVDENQSHSVNEAMREAARMVRLLMPHVELHDEVKRFLDLTDDDLARLNSLGDLHMADAQGRA